MKKRFLIMSLAVVSSYLLYSCGKSFLDRKPEGVLDEAVLANEKGVGKVLIAAYAMLDGHDNALALGGNWGTSGSNFAFAGIGGGEAATGSYPGDQAIIEQIERHDNVLNTNPIFDDRWKSLYEGVKRANVVLELIAKASGIDDVTSKNLAGQAHFLRGWYHFELRRTFGKVPYINEDLDMQLSSGAISGVANDHDILPEIEADAQFAYDNCLSDQNGAGRINKWNSGAFLGKVLLYAKKYPEAKTVLQNVVTNGKTPLGVPYGLMTKFDDNFNVETENNKESVFGFQSSVNDGASGQNGNYGDALNLPVAGSAIGCCGFFQPSFELTNAFKTDGAGHPLANPNTTAVLDPDGQAGYTLYAGNVDPRLDWTVGRKGIPYHDWGVHGGGPWQRLGSDGINHGGPFSPKKNIIRQSQVGSYYEQSFWSVAAVTALNINLIRFSDVKLMLAEAMVETNDLPGALIQVNDVRTRAANSTVKKYISDANPTGGFSGVPAATYAVSPYGAFATQADARAAVHLERKIELAMEGHRFFDLVRWGESVTALNAFYSYESLFPKRAVIQPKPNYTAAFDYYPVPQNQIDLSHGTLTP